MLVTGNTKNEIRWSEGERLDHLFEARVDAFDAAGEPDHLAVIAEDATLTFRELDNRANRLARFLRSKGLKAGDRIGLLFDKTSETYVALLAVLKINAAYVPLDCGFPNERIEFILEDAEVKAILSLSRFTAKLEEFNTEVIYTDEAANEIARFDRARLSDAEKGSSDDQLAYLIYTSGTTGKPKGVIIEHASICNFVRVAAETYGIEAHDRVYQGMTIAFDFSVEELWVPLLAGATLVPGKPGASLVGEDLADFLSERRVTVLACVPTLLATIERDLPDLRILLVSGEACPHGLVSRWHQPGRVILNAYGPTEATVTATLTELYPEKPVTIGGPLPTYTIVILDEYEARELADGETGEIAIAGIGLAAGYLNRDDLTAQKFVPDFLNIPNNPSGCIYRTGDLGRINEDGEIEFLGRIDTQVKLRGYRIELTEIESVLLESPDIAQAVVDVWESEPGAKELVAYVSLNKDVDVLCQQSIAELLRGRLPGYMVPSYLEQLPVIPMTVNDKADRKKLPAPKGPRFTVITSNYVAPESETETIIAEELCAVLNIERASIDDHFFQDLGGHSLLMARLCTALRRRLSLADISMRDVYLNPTVRKLAAHLGASAQQDDVQMEQVRAPEMMHIPSNLQYYGCGVLQTLFYLGYGLFGIWLLVTGFEWTYAVADDFGALYTRVIAYAAFMFALSTAIPLAAKWLLIGKWKEESIPIWSLGYFRFWVVRSVIFMSPLAAFRGTPIFNLYLRMLGAKIGTGTVIKSKAVPVCTDLVEIGNNCILQRDSLLLGYKAQSNIIHTGPITIGDNAMIGEASVIDTYTVMEDNTQLGHVSSLQSGQVVPEGKRFHGSPAVETTANYSAVEPRECSRFRRWAYPLFFMLIGFAIFMPLSISFLYSFIPSALNAAGVSAISTDAPSPSLVTIISEVLPISLLMWAVSLPLGLVGMAVIPRLLARFIKEDKAYPLFGLHYFLHGVVSAASNSKFYNRLFGDSSAIVHYLKFVGYNLNKVVQSGSNFGLDQRHDQPFLCSIGSETMVSDGLSMMNADYSSSSFKVSSVKIGDRNYLGNSIHYPSGGRTGDNCLIGTKTMIPVDGPVREDVGLLGSPAFEIPRAVERDREMNVALDPETKTQRIRQKNKHNFLTAIFYLGTNWVLTMVAMMGIYLALLHYPTLGLWSFMAFGLAMTAFVIPYFALVERASLGFRKLQPRVTPMLEQDFWAHERHWKLSDHVLTHLFAGTPMRNFIWRMLGIKIGRKVFDDGGVFVERTLIEIGDYANFNFGAIIQGHSLEEGVFKSDRIRIGAGATVGVGAFVHYGATMGNGSVLEADSFLMKGESMDARTVWHGNPARAVTRMVAVERASVIVQPADIAA